MTDLSIVEAKSRFSEFVARAAAGERFVIHRRSRPLAILISPAELERLQRTAELGSHLAHALGQDPALLEAVAEGAVHPIMTAYGLWQAEEDLDDLAAEIAPEPRITAGAPGAGAMKILDSDHCIAILRGQLDVRGRVNAQEVLGVTSITVGELMHGAHRSAQAEKNPARVEVLLAAVVVLPFDEAAGRHFGRLKAQLERGGNRLADLDLQIAAICLAAGATLVTHNARHFGRVEGLQVEDWLEG